MSESIWPTIHAERQALIDDLGALSDEQWATQSLCAEWTVHDVFAHLTSLEKMTPPKFFVNLAGAGFNFNKFAARQVAREGAGGPAATMAEYKAAAGRTSTPPGPKDTWLGEHFVHGEDIRRPLGITRSYPLPAVTQAVAFYAKSNVIIGGRDRVARLTLRATDTDFSVGSGPEVAGPAIALLLAASGRSSAHDELAGPGLETLRARS